MMDKRTYREINAHLGVSVLVHSRDMAWTDSPSKLVRRKRFFLRGPSEAGQVTSLVQYLPGAVFPEHPHPQGEEIMVLDGVFSDQTGDWPAGSWLLNPEGFSHAPGSGPGCLLFVKLRQYPGRERMTVQTGRVAWPRARAGVLMRRDAGCTRVLPLAPGERRVMAASSGLEGFVLSGHVRVQGWSLGQHDWFRVPPGEDVVMESGGCTLYIDEDSVSRLAGG